MIRHQRQHAIGVFLESEAAQQCITRLRDADFSMDKVTVLTQDEASGKRIRGVRVHHHAPNKDLRDGAKAGGITGGIGGVVLGLFAGVGVAAIPGLGPIVVAGSAIGTAFATAAAGGVIGGAAGGGIGALIGWGVPENRAQVYRDCIAQGYYLILLEGSEAEVVEAEQIFSGHGVKTMDRFNAPASLAQQPPKDSSAFNPADQEPFSESSIIPDPSEPSEDSPIVPPIETREHF